MVARPIPDMKRERVTICGEHLFLRPTWPSGSCRPDGHVCCLGQQPWLFSKTI